MKKDNNGFTLIELLTVIAILGVVMGIAVPAYYKYVASSKKKAYQTAEKSMIKSGTAAMLDCVNDRRSEFCKDKRLPETEDEVATMTLQELIDGAYMDKVRDPNQKKAFCDAENSYVYIKKNKESERGGYTYYACLKCSKYESAACEVIK